MKSKEDELYQHEYKNRRYIWHTEFKGRLIVENKSGFHSWFWVGTEEEYDNHTRKYFKNHDLGKIIGIFKFDTIEEFDEKFKLPSHIKT